MEEEIVSFETAKLAKEKGFEKYTYVIKAYDNEGNLGSILDSNTPHDILAPTQSLLQKWLRDKHGILIEVGWEMLDNKGYQLDILKLKDGDVDSIRHRGWYKNYQNYEESLEEGLKEALNLLPTK